MTPVATPTETGFLREDDPRVPQTEALVSFRDIIPKPDHPRIQGIEHHTAQSWCESRRRVPAPAWLINRLDKDNIEKPYEGFSSDGKPDPGVYYYGPDEGAPVEEACLAANKLVERLSEDQKQATVLDDVCNNDAFRMWSNPELYVNEGEASVVQAVQYYRD
jgi:hypothetical protein